MARIRTIKPEFFLNEELASLSALHRLAFIGLWCFADRAGRLEDRPKRLRASILPYDGDADFNCILDDLQAGGFVRRYKKGLGAYVDIPSFTKHQRCHPQESASTIPSYNLGDTTVCVDVDEDTTKVLANNALREGKEGNYNSCPDSQSSPENDSAPISEDGEETEADPEDSPTEDELAVCRSFREDYRDNVDEHYKFPVAVPKAEWKAARRFLGHEDWGLMAHQRLKEAVMQHQFDPIPGKDWKGYAFVVRSVAKLWGDRENLAAKCIRGK